MPGLADEALLEVTSGDYKVSVRKGDLIVILHLDEYNAQSQANAIALATQAAKRWKPGVGMVEAETFTVATKVPSRVERFLASEGDQVKAGQELALMSSPEVAAKEAQARALLQSSEAIQSMSREGARREDVQSFESVWRAAQVRDPV